ncbi:MAG: hypothetical protein Q7T86_16295 [Hyphomicrobiaceae bacterium]|nr:hypothetical protein [Hyphomicrobiaceae bacterium]
MADVSGEISNGQRAFWTFLFYTLCGPFFAALAYAAVIILAPPLKLGALLPAGAPPLGEAVASVFVWAALPAALTALGVMPMVFRRGTFGWIVAAAAGVIAFAAATAIAPIQHEVTLAVLAFGAGLISLAVRHMLLAAGILRSE